MYAGRTNQSPSGRTLGGPSLSQLKTTQSNCVELSVWEQLFLVVSSSVDFIMLY